MPEWSERENIARTDGLIPPMTVVLLADNTSGKSNLGSIFLIEDRPWVFVTNARKIQFAQQRRILLRSEMAQLTGWYNEHQHFFLSHSHTNLLEARMAFASTWYQDSSVILSFPLSVRFGFGRCAYS